MKNKLGILSDADKNDLKEPSISESEDEADKAKPETSPLAALGKLMQASSDRKMLSSGGPASANNEAALSHRQPSSNDQESRKNTGRNLAIMTA